MFKVQGSDQKEYGAITPDALRQWIADRRVDGRTLIQAEGGGPWKPLAEWPEFAPALAAVRPPPPLAPAAVPGGPAKTSGLAVTSLVLGILGFLGVTAIAGIITGTIALVRINRSSGRLKGTGLAIAGLSLSAFMMLMVVPAALLLPALAKAKGRAQSIHCMGNLKQLALACRMYAVDNKDTLPSAATWCDDIQVNVADPRVYQCRSDNSGQRCAYAFNARIAGKKDTEVNPNTVMLFEFPGGWNASGGPELLGRNPRHGGSVNVAFADGSATRVNVEQLSTLRWEP